MKFYLLISIKRYEPAGYLLFFHTDCNKDALNAIILIMMKPFNGLYYQYGLII